MGRTEQTFRRGALFVALLLVTEPVLAHTESGAINSGFLSGFTRVVAAWIAAISCLMLALNAVSSGTF
jgi:hypothetical protein